MVVGLVTVIARIELLAARIPALTADVIRRRVGRGCLPYAVL